MRTRAFGSTGLRVGEIGLGCSNLGESVFYENDAESTRLLERAVERGVDFFDTADVYGYGRSEELLGRVFAHRRDRVVIATKVGMLPSSLAAVGKRALPLLRPVRAWLRPMKRTLKRASSRRQDFSPPHIRASVEGSLRRLRTDRLDLVQLHCPTADVIRRGEAFATLARLVEQGKIRHYGVSAVSVEDALRCLDDPGLASLQVAFNALDAGAADELLPRAARRGVAVIARVPLARGLLTPDRKVKTGTRYAERKQWGADRRALEALAAAVETRDRSLLQAALQFVLQHPAISVAIPGTRTVAHLDHILDTAELPPLTALELSRMRVRRGAGLAHRRGRMSLGDPRGPV